MEFSAKYGFAGIYTEYSHFVVEGLNEKGLSAGLFFFPGYGQYPEYNEKHNKKTLSDMQFVTWVLSQFTTIDEVKEAVKKVEIVALDEQMGTVHWRISEPGGRVAVLEFTDGHARFFDNPLGVLTNSPGFEWQMTNLGNYVNLRQGAADPQTLCDAFQVKALGGGSGMLGLPGDFTPPSRFVRAAFLQSTAPLQKDAFSASMMAFHLLNNFDVPVGMQTPAGQSPEGLQSATQFTTVSDLSGLRLYYRTQNNCNIRCIDISGIDFSTVKYHTAPLDHTSIQPIEIVAGDSVSSAN